MIRLPPLLLLLLPGLFTACAHLSPPAQTSGPARAPEGVALAVTGQSCFQADEADWPADDLAELVVEVQVENAAVAPVAVERSRLHLWLPDGGELSALGWRAGDRLTVPGGATTRFELRYMVRGSLRCASRLMLDTRGSVTLLGRVLETRPIAFSPSL